MDNYLVVILKQISINGTYHVIPQQIFLDSYIGISCFVSMDEDDERPEWDWIKKK